MQHVDGIPKLLDLIEVLVKIFKANTKNTILTFVFCSKRKRRLRITAKPKKITLSKFLFLFYFVFIISVFSLSAAKINSEIARPANP